jgi:uncharacterized RDD family membrane protein YckC
VPEESSQPKSAGRLQVETPGGALETEASEPEESLPEWRQELSRRLQEIKLKREAGEANPPAVEAEAGPVTAGAEQPEVEGHEPPPRPAKPRRPRRAVRIAGREQQPAEPAAAAAPAAGAVIPQKAPQVEASRWRDIQELIDTTTARLAKYRQPAAAPESDVETARSSANEHGEGKLILLSRTLAGLVDIIIVAVCASSFVFAVDVIDDVEVFDTVSMMYFVLLLLMTYFVYSSFFLGTANQTIGMMLTDLKIVGVSLGRPRAIQILIRSITFLLGSAALGVGLLWSCFDRQSRCLHDRLSQTRVVRVLPY